MQARVNPLQASLLVDLTISLSACGAGDGGRDGMTAPATGFVLLGAATAPANSVGLEGTFYLSSSTGMLQDVIAMEAPKNGLLKHIASKTQKVKGAIEFDITESPALTRIVQRRELVDTLCPNVVALSDGRPVTYHMISRHWEDACAEVTCDTELGKQNRAIYLRDIRSFAANLAEDIAEASKLLGHSSVSVTRKHYRTKATRLKALR